MNTTVIHNGISLVDAQAMRLLNPGTFEAPNAEDLQEIKDGDFVKIGVNKERFWLVVIKVDKDTVTAKVDDTLIQHGIKKNDLLQIPKNCILSIEQPY